MREKEVISKKIAIAPGYFLEYRVKKNIVTILVYMDGKEYPCLFIKASFGEKGKVNALYFQDREDIVDYIDKVITHLYLSLNRV